jgi:hypothetical protein
MKCFGKLCKFLITACLKKHQDMFLVFFFSLLVSKKIHFVECIRMEMIH